MLVCSFKAIDGVPKMPSRMNLPSVSPTIRRNQAATRQPTFQETTAWTRSCTCRSTNIAQRPWNGLKWSCVSANKLQEKHGDRDGRLLAERPRHHRRRRCRQRAMMGCARQRARQGRNKAACISIPWPQLRHAVMGTRMDVGGRSEVIRRGCEEAQEVNESGR